MNELNITSAKYWQNLNGENTSIVATINGQQWTVPMDEANTHYKEILRQVDAGTLTIEAAD
jgi:hypothetical protein